MVGGRGQPGKFLQLCPAPVGRGCSCREEWTGTRAGSGGALSRAGTAVCGDLVLGPWWVLGSRPWSDSRRRGLREPKAGARPPAPSLAKGWSSAERAGRGAEVLRGRATEAFGSSPGASRAVCGRELLPAGLCPFLGGPGVSQGSVCYHRQGGGDGGLRCLWGCRLGLPALWRVPGLWACLALTLVSDSASVSLPVERGSCGPGGQEPVGVSAHPSSQGPAPAPSSSGGRALRRPVGVPLALLLVAGWV